MTEMIENKTFDEIQIGDWASLTRALDQEGIEALAVITGNLNLIDLDPGPADTSMFGQGGGQTGWAATLFATLAGTRLPGLGSIARHIDVRLHRAVAVGVPVTATVTVVEKRPETGLVVLDCRATDPTGAEIATGLTEVVAPTAKMRYPLRGLPKVLVRHEDRYLELLRACEGLPALGCAVVHPCSADALLGAVEAAEYKLITPILVGPEGKIRALANQQGLDISPYRLVPTQHSHQSAEVAVSLVRAGEAQTLMKGSLHTDELLAEVVRKEAGLRTERRISHCFLLSVPTYPRPIIITDAAINIVPTFEEKRDIIQNAIDLAHAIGIPEPKVAILSAVETVTNKIPSTLEAGALCKMADRGQITGGILDGPLAFDNAIDEQAARTKGITSPVAGKADILVVPDLEAGNMLAKQLTFMAGAEAAGIVLGARAPIVLTSRADSAHTRLASCALAVLFADALSKGVALLKAAG
ncbi:MAG: bifunctional enoyl-CoA hydratase/phosphate acetyltransferase [Candidatus Competibacteraceae bacterium]